MPINRFYNFQAAQPRFYETPLNVLQNALATKQQSYDKGLLASQNLYDTDIASLDQDRARANTILSDIRGQIDSTVQNAGGDYSKIGKDLADVARNIKKTLSPGGEGFAIMNNKQQYDKDLALNRELAAKGIITPEQLNAWKGYSLNNYKGTGQIDPLTGTYNGIDLETITKPLEINTLVDEAMSKVVPEMGQKEGWVKGKDGFYMEKVGTTWKRVTPQRLESVARDYINSNEGWKAYSDQLNRFGIPINQQTVDQAIQRGVDSYAYNQVMRTSDRKFIPQYMYKAQHAQENPNPITRRKEFQMPLTAITPISKLGKLRVNSEGNTKMNSFGEYFTPAQLETEGQRALKESTKYKMKSNSILTSLGNSLGIDVSKNLSEKDYKILATEYNKVMNNSDATQMNIMPFSPETSKYKGEQFFETGLSAKLMGITLNGYSKTPKPAYEALGYKSNESMHKAWKNGEIAVTGMLGDEAGLGGALNVVTRMDNGEVSFIQEPDVSMVKVYEPVSDLGEIMWDPNKTESGERTIPLRIGDNGQVANVALKTKKVIRTRPTNTGEEKYIDLEVLRKDSSGKFSPFLIDDGGNVRPITLFEIRSSLDASGHRDRVGEHVTKGKVNTEWQKTE